MNPTSHSTEEKKYKFVSYYKYVFTFQSEDGEEINAGGSADDIYRSGVEAEMTRAQIEKEIGIL